MIVASFNARKAAQVVAFFARQNGGKINVLKLTKLIYLTDRESMACFDRPMLYDQMVSMAHGPVNSATLDLMNGLGLENHDWDEFVGPRQGHDVASAKHVEDTDLDELSHRDLKLLSKVWEMFGHMNQYALRDYTHKNCPEWEDPQGSSNPIPYDRIFKFLNKSNPTKLADSVRENQDFSEMLARAARENAVELDAV